MKVLQPRHVAAEYIDSKQVGLFHLFLNRSFFKGVLSWTNQRLVEKGKDAINEKKLMAYVGIEIAMSIVQLSEIREYWATNMFGGHHDFGKVMSRTDFQCIRGSLKIYPFYDGEVAKKDPLWHSRTMFQHFMKASARIAVPCGVSTLDENTIRCKARTLERTYLKSKPVKYGIRFYAVADWKEGYLHTLWDNGSGNQTGNSPSVRFTQVLILQITN